MYCRWYCTAGIKPLAASKLPLETLIKTQRYYHDTVRHDLVVESCPTEDAPLLFIHDIG
jgi:hypothetical protein